MANINQPFGFTPIWSLNGTVTNFGFDPKRILKTDTTAIFRGDPVLTGTSTEAGYIRQSAGGASVQVAGIFWDCEYYSIAGKIPIMRPTWPGTADAASNPFPANIISNPQARFMVQTGASSGTVVAAAQSNVGNTCDFAYTGASNVGNTTTGISSAYLDLFTAVASAGTTLPFRILGLASDYLSPGSPGSDNTTPYNWVIVGFNFQELRTVTAVA